MPINNRGYLRLFPPLEIPDLLNQLKLFQKQDRFRILHIGNIANNAYLAAFAEREVGIEAYVLSVDYTHIMGSPEWEHCKISRTENKHFSRDFSDCGCEYKRPNWFYQGSMSEIEKSLFSELTKELDSTENTSLSVKIKQSIDFRRFLNFCVSKLWKLLRPIGRKLIPLKKRAYYVGKIAYVIKKKSELNMTSLFQQFDIINFYGASPSLISENLIEDPKNPNFVSTEHGTLRDYIYADYPLSKDAKRGYEKSKVIFVTNQDCLPTAYKMKNSKAFPMPHPINDDDFPNLRKKRAVHNPSSQSVILVPSRHSASLDIDRGKGNQVVYDLIKMCANTGDPFKFRLIEWGDNVEAAKKYLIDEENAGLVEWVDVKSRPLLKESMIEALCVLDQFLIQAYGAVTADAIGLGVPVITAHSCENDINFFGSCAPVLSAKNASEVRAHLNSLITRSDEQISIDFHQSTDWFDQNLSSKVGLAKRLQGYLASYSN
jgi:hypothetical protein